MEKFLTNKSFGLIARLRVFYWGRLLASRPKKFTICGPIMIIHPENLSLGENVGLNTGVYINSRDKVEIGENTILSAHVKINTGGLRSDLPAEQRQKAEHMSSPVIIGKNVWIATGAIINPGVKIGDGVIVGSGSVVTKDLPEYTLCVGVPAKPIKDLLR